MACSWAVAVCVFSVVLHPAYMTTTTTTSEPNTTTTQSTQNPNTYASSAKTTSPTMQSYGADKHVEYEPYDGWYNNFAHPEWGAADTKMLRLLPPAYGDGVYMPAGANRPNPHLIAEAVFDGQTGHPSYKNRTAFLVFFGQQLVEEILDAQRAGCPPEYFNIPIPKGHSLFDPEDHGGRELPFLRTRYDMRTGFSPHAPREQLNEVTPFFDGNLMYGPNKAWTDAIRLFKDGLLAATNDSTDPGAPDIDRYFPAINDIRLPFANPSPPRDHILKPIRRFYKIGNPRGNENPFLLTWGIVWFRYHNFRARQLKANYPDWDDEKLFNEARKWTIAVHQKIVYFEWIPAWLGSGLEDYAGYDPNVHPQIAHVFQSAAMRFGHTMVPPGVLRRTADCEFRRTTKATMFEGHRGLRTCNSYWNPQESIRESDIDEFLMGMASQVAEREDHIVTPDLHGHVFGTLDFSRRDLMAVNIQRGRDHGLPDYNTARRYFGLDPITNWKDINKNTAKLASLDEAIERTKKVYNGSLENVDIWAGGMLETTPDGPGPLFERIIKNQFRRIRAGDRFWFENYKQNGLFTKQEVDEIMATTVKKVVLAVTNIPDYAIQDNPFFLTGANCIPAFDQLNAHNGEMENCTRVKSFDYFSGSEVPYILTVLFVLGSVIPFTILLLLLARHRKMLTQKERAKLHQSRSAQPVVDTKTATADEWIGHKQGCRRVLITLDDNKQRIVIAEDRKVVRTLDLSKLEKTDDQRVSFMLSADVQMKLMLVRVPKEYDLVLKLDNGQQRQATLDKFTAFLRSINMPFSAPVSQTEHFIKQHAITKDKRQMILDKFFSAIFAKALNYDEGYARHSLHHSRESAEYLKCELTKSEFADALGLQPDNTFVTNMFKMVDTNDSGYISFREFLDFFVIFRNGSGEDKAHLLFNMYDIDNSGSLSKNEFKTMLKSMVELGNERVEEDKIDHLVDKLFRETGSDNKSAISFTEFQQVLKGHDLKEYLNVMSLDMQFGEATVQSAAGRRATAVTRARQTLLPDAGSGTDPRNRYSTFAPLREVQTVHRTLPKTTTEIYYQWITSFIENYRRQIFWVVLYTLVLFGVFIERAYFFAIEREAAGLRRICGYGVSITRGAASAMMFTYASMLVTMCRSVITYLRETFLHIYVPFDDAVTMHKYIAFLAAVFTLVHIVGHCFNIYHISSQTPSDLACLFRNYFHATDELPKFQRWAWDTLTGFTGFLLTFQFFLIFIFSIQYARRYAFRAFWIVHLSYPIFFILMLLHGAGRMIQAAYTYYFVLGPIILFTIDQLISVSRRKIEIPVVSAKLLPSDVTYLEMKKPPGFNYKSGQWIRIACLKRGENEYHPFTLTSAPHEENLKLYIRAVGPWTLAIRRLYDSRLLVDNKFPTVFVDGPYGEGHQDWHRYDVSIMVGGGIGVTPFASILKDVVEKSRAGIKFQCQKVYFVWVTRTQRQFEWMTDILREVEQKDTQNLAETHIFITQYKEKFDVRTTMLYICEKYFQKVADCSLFTGLRSVTHFGRPNFTQFFDMVRAAHRQVSVFGVFTCGPPALTQGVDKACAESNKYVENVLFIHHHENF